jgi:ABC-type proline/glycine betaine transport system permease subunit
MSYSIYSANRGTHLKIVLVSVIASIIVVGIGIAAGPRSRNTSQIEATARVLKAGKPVNWTSSESAVIR